VLLDILYLADQGAQLGNTKMGYSGPGGEPVELIVSSDEKEIAQHFTRFKTLSSLLGLLQKDPEDWFKGGASADEEAEFDAIAKRREQARAQKGTKWRKA